jgi:hypothetical protein
MALPSRPPQRAPRNPARPPACSSRAVRLPAGRKRPQAARCGHLAVTEAIEQQRTDEQPSCEAKRRRDFRPCSLPFAELEESRGDRYRLAFLCGFWMPCGPIAVPIPASIPGFTPTETRCTPSERTFRTISDESLRDARPPLVDAISRGLSPLTHSMPDSSCATLQP